MRSVRAVGTMRAVRAMACKHRVVVDIPQPEDQLPDRAFLLAIDNAYRSGSRVIHVWQKTLCHRERTDTGDSAPQEQSLGGREKSTRPGKEIGELLGESRKLALHTPPVGRLGEASRKCSGTRWVKHASSGLVKPEHLLLRKTPWRSFWLDAPNDHHKLPLEPDLAAGSPRR
jgi:hypothetical protein